MSRPDTAAAPGPPPLRPFGLVLHRDGRFSHEGQPIRNTKLRTLFERSVRYLPEEGKFVVRAGRFRGQVEVEEAAFFVRQIDLDAGALGLSDGSTELLVAESLAWSSLDSNALLCRVKHDLVPGGLAARFTQSAQAELLLGAEERGSAVVVEIAGRRVRVPEAGD